MRLDPVRPRHGADEPGLQEGAPLVDQTAVTTIVILRGGGGGGGGQNTGSVTHTLTFSIHQKQTQVEPPTHTVHIKKSRRVWRAWRECGGLLGCEGMRW